MEAYRLSQSNLSDIAGKVSLFGSSTWAFRHTMIGYKHVSSSPCSVSLPYKVGFIRKEIANDSTYQPDFMR